VGSDEKDIVEGKSREERPGEEEGRLYLIYRGSVCISCGSIETV